MTDENDFVVNTYEEAGPQRINLTDQKRIKSYADEVGITRGRMFMHRGYPALRVTCAELGSKFQEWRERRRTKEADREHLESIGSDNTGDTET